MKLAPRASRHSSFARSTPPNSKRARRSASSRATPRRTKSSAYASTWNRSSVSISLSIRERRNIPCSDERKRVHSRILPPRADSRFQQEVPRLFVLQRHHGIHAHRSPRRQVTREQRDPQQEQ